VVFPFFENGIALFCLVPENARMGNGCPSPRSRAFLEPSVTQRQPINPFSKNEYCCPITLGVFTIHNFYAFWKIFMSKLTGHVELELVRNDGKAPIKLTIQGDAFGLEEGGEPVVEDGETSTSYLFRYIGPGFALTVDFVEVENRIFSYELKSEFLKKDFKSVDILEDELDFTN
jgi:hypothetical protein